MLKKELLKGIILYIFEPEQGEYYGNTITALINDDKVILIDTGYAYQAKAVMEDLNSNKLTIEKIIITHFHDDHMEGLKVLPDVPVYGSNYYQKTLDMWTLKEEHKYFTPTILVEEPLTIQFGKHEIENVSLYLSAVLSNSNEITFEEATKECSCTFIYKEWHENVYK